MEERLRRGLELFNEGRFFESHEVLEEAWMPEQGPRRLFLQGIIHAAVAFHHLERGNLSGARRQLQKGLDKLETFVPACEGVETGRLFHDIIACLEQIDRGENIKPCRIGYQPG